MHQEVDGGGVDPDDADRDLNPLLVDLRHGLGTTYTQFMSRGPFGPSSSSGSVESGSSPGQGT